MTVHCSLVKMVLALAQKAKSRLTWPQLVYAIRRSFGGLAEVDPVKIFQRHFDNFAETYKVCYERICFLVCLF
jgi:hypothetical protein